MELLAVVPTFVLLLIAPELVRVVYATHVRKLLVRAGALREPYRVGAHCPVVDRRSLPRPARRSRFSFA